MSSNTTKRTTAGPSAPAQACLSSASSDAENSNDWSDTDSLEDYDYDRNVLWPWVRRTAIAAIPYRFRTVIGLDPTTTRPITGVTTTMCIYFPIRRSSDPNGPVNEQEIWTKFYVSDYWRPDHAGTRGLRIFPKKNRMIKVHIPELKPEEVPEEMHGFFHFDE